MDGTAELRQLAELLRITAETAANIAGIRPGDATALRAIADAATALAGRLDAIAIARQGSRNGAD